VVGGLDVVEHKLWPPSSPDLNPIDLVIWDQLNVSFTSTNEQIRIRPGTEFFAVLHLFQ